MTGMFIYTDMGWVCIYVIDLKVNGFESDEWKYMWDLGKRYVQAGIAQEADTMDYRHVQHGNVNGKACAGYLDASWCRGDKRLYEILVGTLNRAEAKNFQLPLRRTPSKTALALREIFEREAELTKAQNNRS